MTLLARLGFTASLAAILAMIGGYVLTKIDAGAETVYAVLGVLTALVVMQTLAPGTGAPRPRFRRARRRVVGNQTADGAGAARVAEATAAVLRQGELVVAVAGGPKRGKSSIVNAIVEAPDLIPFDTEVPTNLVTTVRYGDHERFLIDSDDVDTTRSSGTTEHAQGLRRYGLSAGALLLTVELPSEVLRDGLVVVDTPSVRAEGEGSTIARALVAHADASVVVLDALSPPAVEELELMKVAHEHGRPIVCVVNKNDAAPDIEAVLTHTRQLVRSALSGAAENIPVIAVSAHAQADYLRSGDRALLESSGFNDLMGVLRSLSTRRRLRTG